MPEAQSKVTHQSLVLQDPRRYALKNQRSRLTFAIREARVPSLQQVAINEAVAQARGLVENGENQALEEALLSARDATEYKLTRGVITHACCQQIQLLDLRGDATVHLVFAMPMTVHTQQWPLANVQPREGWINFSKLKQTLKKEGGIQGARHVEVLPRLFTLDDLKSLRWSAWYSLALVLPHQPADALAKLLPPPVDFAPFQENSAQARVILGAFAGTREAAQRFITQSLARDADVSITLTKELQEQLGLDSGLKVVAGAPDLAITALGHGMFMNNCAQLMSLEKVIADSFNDQMSFKAEAHAEDNGAGSILFGCRSASYGWQLSNAEPWPAIQGHWRSILRGLPARYLRVQLGLTA